MRLFDGNQSKYCYSLTNSLVEAGAFFLVRVGIWGGVTPPYTPKDSDGIFRFKMIVDATEWRNVNATYGSTDRWTFDMYTRAQRNSIDFCLARITSDGDAPFLSTLELRPLPSTLTATMAMNFTNGIANCLGHNDYGVPADSDVSFTRYNFDALDRIWISRKASATDEVNTTTLAIDVSQRDELPSRILQTTLMGGPYISRRYSNLEPEPEPNSAHIAEFYFAEIDPAVTVPGQPGEITFNFTPTATSVYPPFLVAVEVFEIKIMTNLTSANTVTAMEDIKASLGLSSSTGDPCLPVGYGYPWLNCSGDSGITALMLSKYGTGGEIPAAINSLPTLTEIYLDGNNLQGEIPDLSSLLILET
ncbi:hypothetical protein GOP47_0022341, partial [Adiantum capillus-veneris]